MLVTLHSKAWGSITLFGEVAVTLLRMMGHSGTVPGALRAADIRSALTRLQRALDVAIPQTQRNQNVEPSSSDSVAPPAGLKTRAGPLIQMLSAASLQECDVMWDNDHPVI